MRYMEKKAVILATAMAFVVIALGCKSESADGDEWIVQRVHNKTEDTITVSSAEVSSGSYVDMVPSPFNYAVAGCQFTYDGRDLEVEILNDGEWRAIR